MYNCFCYNFVLDEVLKCGVCAYTCISTASMKSHLRIHTKDKPFSCKHCSYTCRQQGKLCRLQHVQEHIYVLSGFNINFVIEKAKIKLTQYLIKHFTMKMWGRVEVQFHIFQTFKNRASYIQDGRTATLQMLHFIYIFFNKYKY